MTRKAIIVKTKEEVTFHKFSDYSYNHIATLRGDVSCCVAFPVAVIEHADGSVEMINATSIKFTDAKEVVSSDEAK